MVAFCITSMNDDLVIPFTSLPAEITGKYRIVAFVGVEYSPPKNDTLT
jgi:hypothetical protein